MDIWLLWLMTITQGIGFTACFLGILGVVLGVLAWGISSIILVGEKDDRLESFNKKAQTFFIWSLVFLFVGNMLPDRKDWYFIVGGYYVTNIEGIDKIPPNVVGAMNKFLEEYSGEEEKKKKKDKDGDET